MNWYVRMTTAGRVVTAQPNYFSSCPKCGEQTLYDLIWEKRGEDPSVWAESVSGDRLTAQQALADPAEVSAWHSREKLTCPHCTTTYYTQVAYRIKPATDMLAGDEAEPVPDAPPTGDPYSDKAVAAV